MLRDSKNVSTTQVCPYFTKGKYHTPYQGHTPNNLCIDTSIGHAVKNAHPIGTSLSVKMAVPWVAMFGVMMRYININNY